jgi:glycosyltransferase involved in cell wall biosynthesis
MPVFNRAAILLRTLDSIGKQSFHPFELLLVDNGSSDQSETISEQFRQQHQQASALNIRLLQEPKQGANAARNKGLLSASGDYLLFFDSDDLMYPDCLETVYQKLEAHHFPEALVFSYVIRKKNGKRTKRPHRFSANPAKQLIDPVIATHNVCVKRTLVEKVGLWDESLQRWQDLEFGFRLMCQSSELVFAGDKPLYEVLEHDQAISSRSYSEDLTGLSETLAKIEQDIFKLPDGPIKEKSMEALGFKCNTLASLIKREGNRELS